MANGCLLDILKSMRVRVLLFGQLKDIIGAQEDSLDLESGARISEVVGHYARKFSRFESIAPSIACSVNQEYASGSTVLRDGDEVGLLPPVSGGSQESGDPVIG